MSRVLLANGQDSVANPVHGVAAAMAQLLGADVDHIELGSAGRDRVDLPTMLTAPDPDASLLVLRRNRLAEAGGLSAVRRSTRPVLVVPDMPRGSFTGISRVLVPLDGNARTTGALAGMLRLCAASGLDVVVLHVFDRTTTPRCWDQAGHERQAWEQEFLARTGAVPGVRLHLRNGTLLDHLGDVADAEKVDMIALGWSGQAAAGRAPAVRRALAEAAQPVLLVPIGSG